MPNVRRFWGGVGLAHDRANNGTSERQVVYGHRMHGEDGFFHIGSGPEKRARTLTGRSSAWQQFVDAHGGVRRVEVVVLESYRCPARARLREMQLVGIHQPLTNRFGRSSIPDAILGGHPKRSTSRCECGAPDCYGAELVARPMIIGAKRIASNPRLQRTALHAAAEPPGR